MGNLCIRNLKVNYAVAGERHTAVDDVSFSLKKGEVLGIAGASGCGKSTVAKAITGILPENAKASGEILLDGHNILSMTEKQLSGVRGKRISMVFQDPTAALNPVRKIKRQFCDILWDYKGKLGRKGVIELIADKLERVHLQNVYGIMEQYPFQLSGGMRQRVMIAMAICTEPEIIIADEPTSAVDAAIKNEILNEFENIKKTKDMGMIFISHNLAELCKVCDRIAVMNGGRIVEEGSAGRIFGEPAHEYTRELLDAVKTSI